MKVTTDGLAIYPVLVNLKQPILEMNVALRILRSIAGNELMGVGKEDAEEKRVKRAVRREEELEGADKNIHKNLLLFANKKIFRQALKIC